MISLKEILNYGVSILFKNLLENRGLLFFLNKKNQGFQKMTKNYCANLNPANSPPELLEVEETAGSNNAGFLTVCSIIFLTPFF
jgi:hypothetical protein